MTPWTAARQGSLSFTISWSLLKPMSIESMMPSNHLILHHSLPLLPSIFPSIKVLQMSCLFTSGGQSIGASASVSVLQWILWFISFKIGWFDLLTVQGTLKSLLQCHHSKASILQCSAFFMVQCSHSYDYWKNHSLIILCVHAKSLQLYLTLCDPMDCSLPGSSVHGIIQTTIMVWVAMLLSRGSSWPRDGTHISCVSFIGGWVLYH